MFLDCLLLPQGGDSHCHFGFHSFVGAGLKKKLIFVNFGVYFCIITVKPGKTHQHNYKYEFGMLIKVGNLSKLWVHIVVCEGKQTNL